MPSVTINGLMFSGSDQAAVDEPEGGTHHDREDDARTGFCVSRTTVAVVTATSPYMPPIDRSTFPGDQEHRGTECRDPDGRDVEQDRERVVDRQEVRERDAEQSDQEEAQDDQPEAVGRVPRPIGADQRSADGVEEPARGGALRERRGGGLSDRLTHRVVSSGASDHIEHPKDDATCRHPAVAPNAGRQPCARSPYTARSCVDGLGDGVGGVVHPVVVVDLAPQGDTERVVVAADELLVAAAGSAVSFLKSSTPAGLRTGMQRPWATAGIWRPENQSAICWPTT